MDRISVFNQLRAEFLLFGVLFIILGEPILLDSFSFRYNICIYGESRHMLFWIPQYLYVFVAQRPQQVPAVVHS